MLTCAPIASIYEKRPLQARKKFIRDCPNRVSAPSVAERAHGIRHGPHARAAIQDVLQGVDIPRARHPKEEIEAGPDNHACQLRRALDRCNHIPE